MSFFNDGGQHWPDGVEEFGIGVEEEDEGRVGLANRTVYTTGKAEIGRAGEDADIGVGRDGGESIIGGSVVYYINR